jgi:hypothetical protein
LSLRSAERRINEKDVFLVVDKIKVAVVDDSLFIRTIVSDMLSSVTEIDIVGTA